MACCCKSGDRIAASCLGRCDLPKHHCLEKEDVKPGPIPACMGWLYTAKDSPSHQLRCGWRPGHISCDVLRRMDEYCCAVRCGRCSACTSGCGKPCRNPCTKPACSPCRPCSPKPICWPTPTRPKCPSVPCCRRKCFPPPCRPPKCYPMMCYVKPKCYPSRPRCYPVFCPSKSKCLLPSCSPCDPSPCGRPYCTKPMVRIIRHNGRYKIITKPENITNHPSGPYPLKYVIDNDDASRNKDDKFCIEAKFNDQRFDYTSSQCSFVLDFSPPDNKCFKPCSLRSSVCFPCQNIDEPLSCTKCSVPIEAHK